MAAVDCDVLILGGGAAGCVLAGRLSADPARRVTLVEAGDDHGPDGEPPEVLDAYSRASAHSRHFWPATPVRMRRGDAAQTRFLQARVLGGGSMVMGMQALRGLPADYDRWQAMGAAGWGWAEVLPAFRRLETDLDFRGPEHGDQGPYAIRRLPVADWPSFSAAVAQALVGRGIRQGVDINTDFGDGLFPMPLNSGHGLRISAPRAYLGAPVRTRPNLTLLPRHRALRLLHEGGRVTGAIVGAPGGIMEIRAAEVMLCCGAIRSPALLLVSGIGPADDLRALGIPVIADLPGVGANLQNHPILALATRLRVQARQPADLRPHIHSVLRYTSALPGAPAGDMAMTILNKTAWHRLGGSIAALAVSLNHPFSRGRVSLRSADPLTPPLVEMALLDDARDGARMAEGLRLMAGVLASPALKEVAGPAFLAGGARAVRALAAQNRRNEVAAAVLSAAMDVSPWLERRLLRRTGTPVAGMDPAALEAAARRATSAMYHPAGTCRMGGDGMAVTDPQGRVRGVEGLRVADASLMPAIPRGNTFLPTTMVAERIAAMMGA